MSFTRTSTGGKDFIRLEFNWQFPARFIDFAKKSGQIINEDVIHDVIVDALLPAWNQARTNAPEDTGWLKDHIFVYMTTKVQGWLSGDADYTAAQEYGYTDRWGKKHSGRNFMTPAWNTALKQMSVNLQSLQKAFISGQKATFKKSGVNVKSGSPQSVKKPNRTSFQRTATGTNRPRYKDLSGIMHVGRKKVLKYTPRRTQPRKLQGGTG